MSKKKLLILLAISVTVLLSGCDGGRPEAPEQTEQTEQIVQTESVRTVEGRARSVSSWPETLNVKIMSDGYIQYDIKNGEITCREHFIRSEMACWKNF